MPKYEIVAGTVVLPGYVGPEPDFIWYKGEVKTKGDHVEMTEADATGVGRHKLRKLDWSDVESKPLRDKATSTIEIALPVSPVPLTQHVDKPIAVPSSSPTLVSTSRDWSFIAAMKVPDAATFIETVNDLADLQAIREAEIKGGNGIGRTGVLGKILVRVSQIKNASHADDLE